MTTVELASDAVPVAPDRATTADGRVGLRLIFLRFLVIGATSFGGGILSYLRQLLVERTRWLTPDEFMAALEIGQTLPGLNATNISVITGGRLRGARGATVALLAMILPGAIAVFVLGRVAGGSSTLEAAALAGVAAGSVGLLTGVMLKVGHEQLRQMGDFAVISATFVLMSVLHWPLLAVLAVMAPIGIALHRPRPAGPAARSEPAGPLAVHPHRLARLLHPGTDRA